MTNLSKRKSAICHRNDTKKKIMGCLRSGTRVSRTFSEGFSEGAFQRDTSCRSKRLPTYELVIGQVGKDDESKKLHHNTSRVETCLRSIRLNSEVFLFSVWSVCTFSAVLDSWDNAEFRKNCPVKFCDVYLEISGILSGGQICQQFWWVPIKSR